MALQELRARVQVEGQEKHLPCPGDKQVPELPNALLVEQDCAAAGIEEHLDAQAWRCVGPQGVRRGVGEPVHGAVLPEEDALMGPLQLEDVAEESGVGGVEILDAKAVGK